MKHVTRIRDLEPGDRFYLLRTMQRYTYIGVDKSKGKTRHLVQSEEEIKVSDLHHSCHVKRIVRSP